MGISPVELQLSAQVKASPTLDISNQARKALKDPQLEKALNQALSDIVNKPGTTRFHQLTNLDNMYAFNIGSGGGRAIVQRVDGRFSIVGLLSDHDYAKWQKNKSPQVSTNAEFKTTARPEAVEAPLLTGMRGRSGVKTGIAGAILAVGTGIAAAAEPGATYASVTDAVVDSAVPGWTAVRHGHPCRAIGETTGAIAGGAAMVAVTPEAVVGAVGVTAVSGPFAPVVGPAAGIGAAAVVVGAGTVTDRAVTPAVENGCHTAIRLYEDVIAGSRRLVQYLNYNTFGLR